MTSRYWVRLKGRQAVPIEGEEEMMAFDLMRLYHAQYYLEQSQETLTRWRLRSPEGCVLLPDQRVNATNCTAQDAFVIEWLGGEFRRPTDGNQCWCCFAMKQ